MLSLQALSTKNANNTTLTHMTRESMIQGKSFRSLANLIGFQKTRCRWYLPAPKHGDGVLSDGAYLSNPAYEVRDHTSMRIHTGDQLNLSQYLWYQSDATATVASLIADFHVWAINANHASELVETGDFMNPIFERDDESTVSVG